MKCKTKKILLFSGLVIFTSLLVFSFSIETAQAGFILEVVKKLLSASKVEDIGNLLLKLGACIIGTGIGFFEVFLWIVFKLVIVVIQDLFKPEYYQNVLGGFAVNEIVIQGWKVIAGICNMFYILVLLFIGVGTLLRIEKYNYKKLLIKLIVAALLTNFSLLFAGIILDLFHVLMFNGAFGEPLKEIDTVMTAILWDPFSKIWGFFKNIFDAPDMMTIVAILGGMVAEAIFMALVSIAIVATAAFLVIRTVALWVLLVLSPVAYIGLVLPDTQGIAKQWWSSFLKYAMAGPILFFFLWFSSNMIIKLGDSMSIRNKGDFTNELKKENLRFEDSGKVLGEEEDMDKLVTDHKTYIYFLFASFLLNGSLIAAASLSIAGSSRVIRFAQGAVLGSTVVAQKLGFRGAKNIFGNLGERLTSKASDFQPVSGSKSEEFFEKKLPRIAGGAMFAGAGIAKTLSTLEPVTLSRSMYGRFRKMMDAQQAEEEESVANLGSGAKHLMGMAKRKALGQSGPAGDAEIQQRQNARDAYYRKMEKIDEEYGEEYKELKEKPQTEEVKSRRKEIENERNDITEKKKKLNDEWKAKDLDPQQDEKYRKKAEREVLKKKWQAFYYEDRINDQKVTNLMEQIKSGARTTDQVAEGIKYATSAPEIEAAIRLLASKGVKVEAELKDKGVILPNGNLEGFIKERFKGKKIRAGEMLMADLDNLAEEHKNYSEMNKTIIDPLTKKRRVATKQERLDSLDKYFSSQEPKTLARNFQADLIFKTLPDGKKEVADTAEIAIKNISSGFIDSQKKGKTIAPKEIEKIKEFLEDASVRDNLSKEHLEKLEELRIASETKTNKKSAGSSSSNQTTQASGSGPNQTTQAGTGYKYF